MQNLRRLIRLFFKADNAFLNLQDYNQIVCDIVTEGVKANIDIPLPTQPPTYPPTLPPPPPQHPPPPRNHHHHHPQA